MLSSEITSSFNPITALLTNCLIRYGVLLPDGQAAVQVPHWKHIATVSAPASMISCLKFSSTSERVTMVRSFCSKVILSLLSFLGLSSDLTDSLVSAFSGFFSSESVLSLVFCGLSSLD